MFRYVCVPQTLCTEELGAYVSFGIAAQEQVQGTWVQRRLIPDVSVQRQAVEALAQLCTAGQLEPCHLLDAVEDAVV